MRVAAVQFKADKQDPERSLARMVALATDAGAAADLVVLPEMARTGYVFPDRDAVARVAETVDGETRRAMAEVAGRQKTWVVAGFAERDGDRLYNSAMVLDAEGRLVFVYRKTLLYEADLPWATPGDSGYRAFDTANGRFGVGICMDLNDDRFVSWIAAERLPVVAFPTNWVDEGDGDQVWAYWATRLNGCPGTALVAADTWGPEDPIRFAGRSAVLRDWTVHAHLGPEGDGWVRARV